MIPYIFLGLGALSLGMFLFKRDKKSSIVAIALKALTSLFFLLTALFSLYENIGNNLMDNSKLLALIFMILGLIFGMVGDILLDFKIYFKTLNMRFLCLENDYDILMITGMSSFGIGHIFYILALMVYTPIEWMYLIFSTLGAIILMSFIFLISIKVMKMDFRKFFIPSILYGILLACFVFLSIFKISFSYTKANLFILIGSILFIVSDLILSITYFSKKEDYEKKGFMNPESRFMIIMNHITYYAAQFLIAIAILFL